MDASIDNTYLVKKKTQTSTESETIECLRWDH